jgi:natural product biosynthesis luciferase-like monooxygenase protein
MMTTPDPGALQFSLMFFAASDDALLESRYDLVVQSARFADSRGFTSVWVPERHFTAFGCLYPNGAVLHAALARETRNLQLRAGSVVIPLHDPLRIAEEWAMVDNLSGGRVGISAATGWNPNDFAFFPDRYTNRRDEMYRGLAAVRSLWRGESLRVKNGIGKDVEVCIYPRPIQRELPLWLTAAGSADTFIRAGEMGLNVLTHLLDHDVEDIARRIALYREARAAHGWDPDAGEVTVMIHTFVGEDNDAVRDTVRGPYTEWLKANIGLLKGLAANRDETVDLDALSMADKDAFVNFLFERFYASRALMGTPQSCMPLLERLQGVGVTEIACLLDFGPRAEIILDHLPHLHALAQQYWAQGRPNSEAVPALREQARTQLRERATPQAEAGATTAALRRDTLDDIRARCAEEIPSAEFYERLGRSGAQFGPAFRGIERVWRCDGEALAQVQRVHPNNGPSVDGGMYPPFLDACLQVFAAALPRALEGGSGDSVYLPVGLGTYRPLKPAPSQVFSHAILRSDPRGNAEQLEGDVEILDASGDRVCEVRGFRVQRTALDAPFTEDPVGRLFYRVAWRAKQLQVAADAAPGTWVVFVDDLGVGAALATIVEAAGDRCVRVGRGSAPERMDDTSVRIPPADADAIRWVLDRHGQDARFPLKGIVHLWSLDAVPSDQTEAASLELAQQGGVETVLRIVQILAAADPPRAARLWVATRGAQPIADPDPELSPAQSLVWGFGKTIAAELPALWGGLVDLGAGGPEECARNLLGVMHSDRHEMLVGFRNGQAFVPRMVSQPETPNEPPSFAWSNATYLVTGGLGGLGMETARWLAEQGARHLVLLGRQVPRTEGGSSDEPGGQAPSHVVSVRELRARGVNVHCVAADVADRAQLTAAIDDIEARGWPPLRGVVHAAGIGHPEKLVELTPSAMADVLRPKVIGAWTLHRAVAGRPLDFFVMYSSATHQLGILGQGVAAYSAANAFLDGLAHLRVRQGEPGLSICWGPWARVGMAAKTGNDQRLAGFGIDGIEPAQGLRALGHLLGSRRAEAWVISVDWTKLFEADADLRSAPLVSELSFAHAGGESEEVLALRRALIETLRQAPDKLRGDLMLEHVQKHAMDVMRLDSRGAVDWRRGLFDIGMDSLMALELKNRLQASLGLTIPSTLAFTYPDVHAISGYLVQRLFPEATPREAVSAEDSEIEKRVLDATTQIQDLDESELESLLTQKVESL